MNFINYNGMYSYLEGASSLSFKIEDQNDLDFVYNYVSELLDVNVKDKNAALLLFVIYCFQFDNYKLGYLKIAENILLSLNKPDNFVSEFKIILDSIFDLYGISKNSIIYILSCIEGDSEDAKWIDYLRSDFYASDLSWMAEINSLSFPSNVNRASTNKLKFFDNKIALKKVYERFVDCFSQKLNDEASCVTPMDYDKNEKLNVVFVIGKPFPRVENTHAFFFYNHARHFKNENLHFMITGELSVSSPWGDLFPLTERYLKINKSILNRLSVSTDSLYPRCSLPVHNKEVLFKKSIATLDEIKPHVLIFIGGVYESKVFRKYCFDKYPILVLPTTTNVESYLGKPDDYFDLIWARTNLHEKKLSNLICSSRIKRLKTAWRQGVYKNMAFELDGNINLSGKRVICSVLGAGRLSKTISALSSKDVEALTSFITKNDDIVWIFVGESIKVTQTNLKKHSKLTDLILAGRIVSIDHVDNLNGFLELCDCFFAFPHTGGGGAVSLAVDLGIPSAVSELSDSASNVPDSYVYEDLSGGLNILNAFLKNSEVVSQYKEDVFIMKNERTIERSSLCYRQMIEKCIDNFNKRVGS